MGKCTSALGFGLMGAVVGACAYSALSPREQRQIRKGVKTAAEELKDAAEHFTEVM